MWGFLFCLLWGCAHRSLKMVDKNAGLTTSGIAPEGGTGSSLKIWGFQPSFLY